MAASSSSYSTSPSTSLSQAKEKLLELKQKLLEMGLAFNKDSVLNEKMKNNLIGYFRYISNSYAMLVNQQTILSKALEKNKTNLSMLKKIHTRLVTLNKQINVLTLEMNSFAKDFYYQLSLAYKEKDRVKALDYLDQAASLGNLDAQADICGIYIIAQPEKAERGEKFLQMALKEGFPKAYVASAEIAFHKSVKPEYAEKKEQLREEGRRSLERAKSTGLPQAYLKSAELFHIFYPKENRTAHYPILLQQAYLLAVEQQNHDQSIQAAHELGFFYFYSEPPNLPEAKKWFLISKNYSHLADCCLVKGDKYNPLQYTDQSEYLQWLCLDIENNPALPKYRFLLAGLTNWNWASPAVIFQVGVAILSIRSVSKYSAESVAFPLQFKDLMQNPEAFCHYLEKDENRTEEQKKKIIEALPSEYKTAIKEYLDIRSYRLTSEIGKTTHFSSDLLSVTGSYLTLFVDDLRAVEGRKKQALTHLGKIKSTLMECDGLNIDEIEKILTLTHELEETTQRLKKQAEARKSMKGMTEGEKKTEPDPHIAPPVTFRK